MADNKISLSYIRAYCSPAGGVLTLRQGWESGLLELTIAQSVCDPELSRYLNGLSSLSARTRLVAVVVVYGRVCTNSCASYELTSFWTALNNAGDRFSRCNCVGRSVPSPTLPLQRLIVFPFSARCEPDQSAGTARGWNNPPRNVRQNQCDPKLETTRTRRIEREIEPSRMRATITWRRSNMEKRWGGTGQDGFWGKWAVSKNGTNAQCKNNFFFSLKRQL